MACPLVCWAMLTWAPAVGAAANPKSLIGQPLAVALERLLIRPADAVVLEEPPGTGFGVTFTGSVAGGDLYVRSTGPLPGEDQVTVKQLRSARVIGAALQGPDGKWRKAGDLRLPFPPTGR